MRFNPQSELLQPTDRSKSWPRACRCRKPVVLLTRAMSGLLSTRNSSIYLELHSPMSTRESLSAQLMIPIPSVCTRCACCGSVPPATSCLRHFLSSYEHTSSVSESLMWHTLLINGDVSCRVVPLYTSRRSPALSRTRIAHHSHRATSLSSFLRC